MLGTSRIEPGTKHGCVKAKLGDDGAVDLYHGNLLQHPAQQELVALDVDLDQLEAKALLVDGDDLGERLLAEVAPGTAVEDDVGHAALAVVGKASKSR